MFLQIADPGFNYQDASAGTVHPHMQQLAPLRGAHCMASAIYERAQELSYISKLITPVLELFPACVDWFSISSGAACRLGGGGFFCRRWGFSGELFREFFCDSADPGSVFSAGNGTHGGDEVIGAEGSQTTSILPSHAQ